MKKKERIVYALVMSLSSVCSAICGSAKKHKRIFARSAALALAVLIITLSIFEYYVPNVSASDDTGFCDQCIEIYPEGKAAERSVILNGMMPKEASAKAVDVTDDFTDLSGSMDISEENPKASLVAAYDITITSGYEEYQPDNDKPIQVEITDPKLLDENEYELWHIHDNGEKERITYFTVENGKISFTAKSFSVYAIVDVSDPYSAELIRSVNDFSGSRATAGFCLYYGNHKFFTNSLNENGALIETDDPSSAAIWMFTKSGEYYTISTFINGREKFIHTKSGNEIELSDNADLFKISSAPNNSFYLRKENFNKWLQHSGSGNGIRYYPSNSNSTNSRIKIVFADSIDLPDDWYHLNGKSFGIMNYPGGTLGNAFMAQENDNSLSMLSFNVRRETGSETLYVAEDSNITMWTFHYVSGTDYRISTTVNGETKFLKIGDTLSLVDENSSSVITISTDTKKHIKLSVGGRSVDFDGNGFVSADTDENSMSQWLHLVKPSELTQEDHITYYADKVSVSDVPDGQKVIVYTRIWNDDEKAYDFYAIDHDGTLYPCYERGDHIAWLGTKINTLLWDFIEYHYDDGTPNYYYELYNSYSHKYIAPQIQNGQILSDNKIGINLTGRRYGDYYSDILAWDTPYYTYAGLHSDIENGKVVSGAKADADTFYFAIVEEPTSTLTKVNTLDTSKYGITMRMIDFPVQPDSSGHSLQNDFLGTGPAIYTVATKGLLSTDIDPSTGYPRATCSGASLQQLFVGAEEVNHLFLESTYNASGYFEFDSCQCFATLIQPDGTPGTDFTVYRELGTADIDSRTTLKHGQFFPYNTITPGVYSVNNPENLYSALAQYGNTDIGKLPESDPRKYEKLHLVNKKPNYYNGMELSARLIQAPSGKDSWGHDIVFEFTGDDDFWFYVDNELIIDLGGIHSALHGNVNFATGKVVIDDLETDLRTIFMNNYIQRNPEASSDEVNDYLAQFFDGEETVFKDYSAHGIRLFYMERGAGASNLHIRFNLDHITQGNALLTKTVSGSEDIDFNLVEYPFQIWYKCDEDDTEHLLTNDDDVRVDYQNSIQRVEYAASYTPQNSSVTYESVYFLNPSKTAEIRFPQNNVQYRIIECGINHEVYDTVTVNGTVVTPTVIAGTDRSSYDSGWLSLSQQPVIVFDNHVNPESLRTLSVTKRLFDESGNELTAEQDNTGFNFRLYLSNGSDDSLEPANMAKYYVTDPDGMLCTWDPESQLFASTDQSDYSSLTSAQKSQFTFETSMNGAISNIPSGYSVEIPSIPVGTMFKIVERENEIPAGYSFLSYERIGGSYHAEDGDTLNSGWVRANESPKMIVNNRRGWSIEVNKIWSDKDFTSSHDPVFIAVYCGGTLVPDTVSCIAHPSTSKRYFFDTLISGADFEDYTVYEVELDDPVINENGELISYSGIHRRIENGEITYINSAAIGSDTAAVHQYAVTYECGIPVSQAQGTNTIENVRRDTITNTRTDGIALTLYDMHTNAPLADGEFTLAQGDTILGSFVSDSQGRITVFYDFERNTDYTLTETEPPQGYIGLPYPAVFSILDDGSIALSGNEPQWQRWRSSDTVADNLFAYIDVYNKPFTLTAVKVDNVTDDVLGGAHFALYRSVVGIDGTVKDLEPIDGYADLVTDSNGVIPKIDKTLEPGKYYLTETEPPPGYEALKEDIIFTISANGIINIESEGYSEYLTVHETDEYNYILRIPDVVEHSVVELTITKIVTGSFGDRNKAFTFTLSVEGAEAEDEYSWSKNGIQQDESLQSDSEFTMKHGDVIKIMLPVNTNITITENNLPYSTSFKLNDDASSPGNTKSFALYEDSTLEITNSLNAIIPTGIFHTEAGTVIFVISAFFLLAFFVIIIRRHKRCLY